MISDVLHIIFKLSKNNHNNIAVCKYWNSIIMSVSVTCIGCNKIIKRYDTNFWVTIDEDKIPNTRYCGELTVHRNMNSSRATKITPKCHNYHGNNVNECIRYIQMLKYNYSDLRSIEDQTLSICLIAIEVNIKTIMYIRNLTDKLYLRIASKLEIQFMPLERIKILVKGMIIDYWLQDLKYFPERLIYVSDKIKSYDNLVKFMKVNGQCLQYLPNDMKTEEICLAAVESDYRAIKYVTLFNDSIYLKAVEKNGLALKDIENQTDGICEVAVKNNANALEYVKKQTNELCLMAVRKNGLLIRFVTAQTEEIQYAAVTNDPYAIQYISNPNIEVMTCAYRKNNKIAQHIKKKNRRQLMEYLKSLEKLNECN